MTNIKFALAAATAFALLVPAATAANARPGEAQFVRHSSVYAPGIDRRIARQRKRISKARRDGSLTWLEAQSLKLRLVAIRSQLAYVSLDGKVTRHERQHVHQMLDRNNRRIARLCDNDRVGFGARKGIWWDINF